MMKNGKKEAAMKKYQNILCATDFSEAGNVAAVRASEMAQYYGAQLTLLYVVEYFPEEASNEMIAPEGVDRKTFREQQASASLAKLIDNLELRDAAQEIQFCTDSAKKEIVRFAEEQGIDLIVLGSHGHHGITAIVGSTTSGVMHRASCDVFVVRAQ
jgi:universal stress protein A